MFEEVYGNKWGDEIGYIGDRPTNNMLISMDWLSWEHIPLNPWYLHSRIAIGFPCHFSKLKWFWDSWWCQDGHHSEKAARWVSWSELNSTTSEYIMDGQYIITNSISWPYGSTITHWLRGHRTVLLNSIVSQTVMDLLIDNPKELNIWDLSTIHNETCQDYKTPEDMKWWLLSRPEKVSIYNCSKIIEQTKHTTVSGLVFEHTYLYCEHVPNMF